MATLSRPGLGDVPPAPRARLWSRGGLVAGLVVAGRGAAERGGRLRRSFGPTHGTGLVDAILAATAIEGALVLVTNDERHYPMPELTLG